MYIYIYICIYIHTYSFTCKHIYISIHIHKHMFIYVCIVMCICIIYHYIYIYTQIYFYIYIYSNGSVFKLVAVANLSHTRHTLQRALQHSHTLQHAATAILSTHSTAHGAKLKVNTRRSSSWLSACVPWRPSTPPHPAPHSHTRESVFAKTEDTKGSSGKKLNPPNPTYLCWIMNNCIYLDLYMCI